eukprot:136198-Rhodomonas_salina.2
MRRGGTIQDGPAWTTSLVTVYGNGEGADQIGRGWYQVRNRAVRAQQYRVISTRHTGGTV